MSNRLLADAGEALYGPRYRTDLAQALHVNERTVRRWADGVIDMPPGVALDLLRLVVERLQKLDDLQDRLKIAGA